KSDRLGPPEPQARASSPVQKASVSSRMGWSGNIAPLQPQRTDLRIPRHNAFRATAHTGVPIQSDDQLDPGLTNKHEELTGTLTTTQTISTLETNKGQEQ